MTKYNKLPIKHFSYSMMSLWEQCRECWLYKYVMGLKGEIPDYYLDGREVHEEVHKYHTHKSYNADLIAPYTRVFDPDFREQSELWVEDLNNGQSVYLKHTKKLPLPFKGKIDGVNANCINDLKYTSSNISQRQADSNDQATFYIWAYYCLTGKLMPFWYIVFNKKTKRISVVKTKRTKQQFNQAHNRVIRFFDELLEDDFEALPKQRCYGRCEYHTICKNCGGGDHGY